MHCTHDSLSSALPTKSTRLLESGMPIGSSHAQLRSKQMLSTLALPVHKTNLPVSFNLSFAQFSKPDPETTAREVTTSSECSSIKHFSNLHLKTSTPLIPSRLTTSDRNAAFLPFDSMSATLNSGRMIFSANPGNPAPDPTSASRPFSTATAFAANMDSPKCLSRITRTPVIPVRLIFSFHCERISMNPRIFSDASPVGVIPNGANASRIWLSVGFSYFLTDEFDIYY